MRYYKMNEAIEEYSDPPGRSILTPSDEMYAAGALFPLMLGQTPASLQVFRTGTLVPGALADVDLVSGKYPVVTPHARAVIESVARSGIDWRPVVVDGNASDLWLASVVDVRDCVDVPSSDLDAPDCHLNKYGRSGPYWACAYSPVLRRDQLDGAHWFRWLRGGGLFASEALADAFLEHGVTGVWFKEVEVI